MTENPPAPESVLKQRREELGLTQRDVATAANVSVQTVSNWETGRYKEAKLTLPQVKRSAAFCNGQLKIYQMIWGRLAKVPLLRASL